MLHVIANTRFFLTSFVMERLRGVEGVRVLPHGNHDRGLTQSLAKFALGGAGLPRVRRGLPGPVARH